MSKAWSLGFCCMCMCMFVEQGKKTKTLITIMYKVTLFVIRYYCCEHCTCSPRGIPP